MHVSSWRSWGSPWRLPGVLGRSGGRARAVLGVPRRVPVELSGGPQQLSAGFQAALGPPGPSRALLQDSLPANWKRTEIETIEKRRASLTLMMGANARAKRAQSSSIYTYGIFPSL